MPLGTVLGDALCSRADSLDWPGLEEPGPRSMARLRLVFFWGFGWELRARNLLTSLAKNALTSSLRVEG